MTSSKFVCILQFDDNKFDIVIDGQNSCRSFADIYDKIQQIFRLALNQNISFVSYVFELMDSSADRSSIIMTFEDTIRHLSLIRMRLKALAIGHSVVAITDPFAAFLKDNERDINVYKTIIRILKANDWHKSWNFYVQPDIKWREIHRHLIQSNSSYNDYTPQSCHKLFVDLTTFYTIAFERLNLKLEEDYQQTFDSLKSVHFLNAEKVFHSSLWSPLKMIADKPEVKDFLKHGFNVDIVIIQMHKTDLLTAGATTRRSRSTTPVQSFSSNSKETRSQVLRSEEQRIPRLHSNEKLLKDSEKDIQTFHLIIQSFEEDWDLRRIHKKWRKVSDNVIKADPTLKHMTHRKCKNEFYYWLEFYVENFHKLESKLSPELQKTFDLFKIIHTLDIRDLFYEDRYPDNYLYKRLKQIGRRLTQNGDNNYGKKSSDRPEKSHKSRRESEERSGRQRRPRSKSKD